MFNDDEDDLDDENDDAGDHSGIEILDRYHKPTGNAHYNPNIHSKKRKFESMTGGYSSNIGPMKGGPANKRRKQNMNFKWGGGVAYVVVINCFRY